MLWWSGFGSSGPASIVLHGGGGAAARRSRTAPNGGSGGGVCQRPQLDEAKLEEVRGGSGAPAAAAATRTMDPLQPRRGAGVPAPHAHCSITPRCRRTTPALQWGCKVFHKACFDQGGMVLHSGEKTPDNPAFTPDPLFKAAHYPSYVLPGYEEPMGAVPVGPRAGRLRLPGVWALPRPPLPGAAGAGRRQSPASTAATPAGTPHYTPPCWDVPIRGPTPLDPRDIWQPRGALAVAPHLRLCASHPCMRPPCRRARRCAHPIAPRRPSPSPRPPRPVCRPHRVHRLHGAHCVVALLLLCVCRPVPQLRGAPGPDGGRGGV